MIILSPELMDKVQEAASGGGMPPGDFPAELWGERYLRFTGTEATPSVQDKHDVRVDRWGNPRYVRGFVATRTQPEAPVLRLWTGATLLQAMVYPPPPKVHPVFGVERGSASNPWTLYASPDPYTGDVLVVPYIATSVLQESGNPPRWLMLREKRDGDGVWASVWRESEGQAPERFYWKHELHKLTIPQVSLDGNAWDGLPQRFREAWSAAHKSEVSTGRVVADSNSLGDIVEATGKQTVRGAAKAAESVAETAKAVVPFALGTVGVVVLSAAVLAVLYLGRR